MSKSSIIKIIITVISFATIIGAAIVTFNLANNLPVTLDQQYYDDAKIIDINSEEYEKLIADKKSFVIMVDNAGCTTTEKMREIMKNLPQKFTYYRILWPDAKETNLKDYIKYFPSVVVIESGNIKYYLRADLDSDAKYYNDADALESWLNSKVNFKNA